MKTRCSPGERFVLGGKGLGISVRKTPGYSRYTINQFFEARAWYQGEARVCSYRQPWDESGQAASYIEGWADSPGRVATEGPWQDRVARWMGMSIPYPERKTDA